MNEAFSAAGAMRHGYREMRQIGKGSYGVAMLVQDL